MSSDWLRVFRPVPEPAVRLVCFPYAGGSAAAFRLLARELPPDVEVVAVQYPGRQDRQQEPSLTSIDALAEAVLPELDAYTDRPLALLGHSMGALVAFETARRLEAATLIVSGRQGPSAPRPPRPGPLDDAAVIALVRRLDGPGARAIDHPQIRRLALPSLRADFGAVAAYTHRPARLACPVTALTGADDPHVPEPEVRAWERETTGPFALHVLPGGHFFLHEDVKAYATAVGAALSDLRAAPAAP